MDEIRRRDWVVFLKELASARTLLSVAAGWLVIYLISQWPFGDVGVWVWILGLAWGLGWVGVAYRRSLARRWHFRRLMDLWANCESRGLRLGEALEKLRRRGIADLSDLPQTVRRLTPEVYRALRRADLVLHEVTTSEGLTPPVAPGEHRVVYDRQAQELFQVADRNVREYTSHLRSAMAGVERAEAQALVFSTTLDTLRIRCLNYRLVGRSPEGETREFLNVVAEAKMQFEAIDRALDEIEAMPFPEVVTLRSELESATAAVGVLGEVEELVVEGDVQTPPPPPSPRSHGVVEGEEGRR